MFKILIIPFLFLISTAHARVISGTVMLDGSVASCAVLEDVNKTAFRVSTLSDDDQVSAIKIQNLICTKEDTIFSWKKSSLGTEKMIKTSFGTVKRKIKKAILQITDANEFVELQKTDLDTDKAEQTVVLLDGVANNSKIVISLKTYQTITLDDVVIDEGFDGSGHIILTIK